MAYDSLRRQIVMMGGDGPMDEGRDPWEFDGTAWHPVRYSGHIPPTERGAMAYDPRRRQMILFGADERWQPMPGSLSQLTKRVGVRLYDRLDWTIVPSLDPPEPDDDRFAGAFDIEQGSFIAYAVHREAAYALNRPDDIDQDGIEDREDNCPTVENAGQADEDRDGVGDACDTCVSVANQDQNDLDRDGLGDACDDDIDDDDRLNDDDVCPESFFIGRPPEDRLPAGGGLDDDGDGVANDCDPCRLDAANDRDHDGVCGDMDNCALAFNPLQEDTTADGAGDACQPSVWLQAIREDGGEILEVIAEAVDPDGDDVSGSIDFVPAQEFAIANQAPERGNCDLGFLPDGVAGEGIGYFDDPVRGTLLLDLDSLGRCVDGIEDYLMAPGACAQTTGAFNRTISLNALTLPASLCLRTVGGGAPDRDLLLLDRDLDAIHGRLRGGNAVLRIGFSAGLPSDSDISTLAPAATYILSIDATDGSTPAATAEMYFMHQAERVMHIASGFLTARIDLPRQVECNAPHAGRITLDGRGSGEGGLGDPIVRFDWFRHGRSGEIESLGSGPLLDVFLPLGENHISLEVEDASGVNAATETIINVLDTTPPRIVAVADPGVLWPPNGRMMPVHIDLTVDDVCSPNVSAWLVSIDSSDPESASGDIGDATIGAPDTDVLLRAARSSSGPGRSYQLTYAATDGLLLRARASVVIRVPHDRGGMSVGAVGKNVWRNGR